MGKIGDLWVRLGLKSDDYKKGIDKAKRDTKNFGNSMKETGAVAKSVWAAVGAAVIKVSHDCINATNVMGDAFGKMMGAMKSGIQTFYADVTKNLDSINGFFGTFNVAVFAMNMRKVFGFWKDAIPNAKDAADAGVEMAKAFDAEFELVHSVKLQKAMIQGELNDLMIEMKNTTLDPSVRKAASERYKALLQPLADAEIRVYTDMMNKASEAWQAGSGGLLSRQYSTAEMTEFFANYGTNPAGMAAKYPELQAVYETRKNDAANSVIFDTASKLANATAEMSNVDKELARVTLSINKQLLEQEQALMAMMDNIQRELDGGVAEDIEDAIEEVEDIINGMELEIPPLKTDALDASLAQVYATAEQYQAEMDRTAQFFDMTVSGMVSSMSNGIQAITDAMFSIDGADWKSVLAAFIAPLGDTMKQMGELILAEGIAMSAFKNSFKAPQAAIAAGVALIAVGSMVSSGLQSLINGAGRGSGSAMSYSGSGASGTKNYDSTLTVEVVGKISGNDIVLSGKKTNDKMGR